MAYGIRDQGVDFVCHWSEGTEISSSCFVRWRGITPSKWYDWCRRYGRVNEHNAWVPRDFWLEAWEKEAIQKAILAHHDERRTEGYRRLTFMMLDTDIVAVGPTTVIAS